MITFLILYFWNLVLDYPLQGSFLSEYKCKSNYVLYVHCAIWGLGMGLALLPLGLFAWWKLAMLFFGHLVIDYWKCRGHYKKCHLTDLGAYYVDQLLHVGQTILCLF